MINFEDLGRKLDAELEYLREVAEKKISPATRDMASKSLRKASETLSKLAADLEAHGKPQE